MTGLVTSSPCWAVRGLQLTISPTHSKHIMTKALEILNRLSLTLAERRELAKENCTSADRLRNDWVYFFQDGSALKWNGSRLWIPRSESVPVPNDKAITIAKLDHALIVEHDLLTYSELLLSASTLAYMVLSMSDDYKDAGKAHALIARLHDKIGDDTMAAVEKAAADAQEMPF